MREFDKIYIAKYCDYLTIRQLSEDLHVKQDLIKKEIDLLKETEMISIYKNMTDNEWEKLERLDNDIIKSKYYKESQYIQNKVKEEVFKSFKVTLHDSIMLFPKYEYKKEDFDRDYMQETDYENEEWKRIGNSNYEVSNYGRIKNINTKKLKQLKHNRYGLQVLLWSNSKSCTITISRIVAEMFIRHLEENERAVHINGNAKDNYYKNLKIVSK